METASLVDLGRRDYAETWELQKRLVAARQAGAVGDVVLLVEHPHVFTLGRAARGAKNLLAPGDVPVFEVERGGDVTYHGPGQLVGYPILQLGEGERDLHRYLRALEQAIIDAAAAFGLVAGRRSGLTGVWIGDRKVASIGVAVKRWVTLHGFALNVSTDLAYFRRINPCGLDASVMTSLAAAGGRAVTLEAARRALAGTLGPALGRSLEPAALADLLESTRGATPQIARNPAT